MEESGLTDLCQDLINKMIDIKSEEDKTQYDNPYQYIIEEVIANNPKTRLGAKSFEDLKNHPYFTKEKPIYDWKKLANKEYESPLLKEIQIKNNYFEK